MHRSDAPAVVLSPHADDAVLSAWSTLREPGDLIVVDVCAAIPDAGVLGSFDPLFGVSESASFVRDRLVEDREALALAGRVAVHLDFLDDQYRDVALSPDAVRTALEAKVPEAAWLCAPAGIGRHPDHVAVRDAVLAISRDDRIPAFLYADLPYAVQWGWPHWVTGAAPRPHLVPDARWRDDLQSAPVRFDDLVPEVCALDSDEIASKLSALETYRTQFAALNAGPLDRLRHPEIIGFELRWRVPLPS